MNRLVIIDGNAILHRAYHALPPLTAPDGSLVNAVYGFTSMLFKIVHDLKPTHIAVAFDRPKPTFRKKIYKEYQAKRPEMDKELVGQIEKVHDMVRAFGVPIFEKDGFEADDVIGTLARKAVIPAPARRRGRKAGIQSDNKLDPRIKSEDDNGINQVIIVTGDKDILQLVDDKTYVYMPTKGLSEAKLYMEKDVVDRMGVTPQHIPDLKALMGDSSDNYPGVEGIGPKTAVTILQKFGTIDELFKRGNRGDWGDVGEKVKEKLVAGEEMAKLSHDLATIRTDVPIEGELKEIKTIDTPEARQLLLDLHFHSLLKRLDSSNSDESYKHPRPRIDVGSQEKKEHNSPGEQQQLF